jgi:hypothetical protein
MIRALLILCCAILAAGAARAQDAGALRARHAALHQSLANNPFGRPLHVESTATGGKHKGEIYAVIERPYGVVAAALARPAHWCDILTLQVNIKGCKASAESLSARVTRKPREPVDSAHPIDFRFDAAATRNDYLQVALSARSGPVGTRDYEIRLEAAPLDSRRTFMHLSYAYALGFAARVAMDAYLAGAGRDKRGFSVEGGERGVIERSAMRHYLAVESYLESPRNLEARLRQWYAAIARYPQLHETVGAEEYVEMKRREASAAPAG